MIKIIKYISGFFMGIIIFISSIFAAVVYTNEYESLNNMIDKKLFGLTILIWLIIIAAFRFAIHWVTHQCAEGLEKQHLEIAKKSEECDTKDRYCNNLLASNIKIDSKAKILDSMKLFVLNNREVISVQLYEYSELKRGDKSEFEIKPTNYYYTQAGEVANLIHEKYEIRQSDVKKYRDTIKKYNNGSDNDIINYIKEITERLEKKSRNKNPITQDALVKYSLLILATQCYLDGVSFKIENLNDEFIQSLEKAKRTGFLRGILHQEYYKFMHSGNSLKGKRVYITKCLPIDKKNHMFVIIVNPDKKNSININSYLDSIGEKFYETLIMEIESEYNFNKGVLA